MRCALLSSVCAVAATLLLPIGTNAARPCGSSNGTAFQYRLGDVRYDSPDPIKKDNLSTISASLQSASGTPLYECVSQWLESWAGWYNGLLIWGDCVYTGAGAGDDKTVSFAVDWKNKTLNLAHTFACSDEQGSDGLAMGSINLDVNCTTATDGSSYCVPKSTSTGTRPTLNISTEIVPVLTSPTCKDFGKEYQSWKVEDWSRQFKLEPGETAIHGDSGPKFTLRSFTTGITYTCSPSAPHDEIFVGNCWIPTKEPTTSVTASFVFNAPINLLQIKESWNCNGTNAPGLDFQGALYMQAACERELNSDEYTCTANPVWVGTGGV